MSEETGSVAESGGNAPDTSGIAMEIALEEARNNPLHAAKVDAFLGEQIALAAIQKQHLQRHLREQTKQLRWSTWEKRMGVFLRVATAGMGLAIAGALAFMVSDAMHSNDLRIEPFSVPPQFAASGLTGEVVAARILDRLSVLQSQSNTARPAQSFTNSWGENGIKLEIPETGVSFAELDQWLRQKFGHDIRLTGEIVRTASGITLTARAGALGAESVSGPEESVDELTNRLAESIYRITQPFRYAST